MLSRSTSWHSFIRGRCHMATTSIPHQGSGETYLFLWVSIPGFTSPSARPSDTTRPVSQRTQTSAKQPARANKVRVVYHQSVSRRIAPTLGDKQGFSARRSPETRT